MAHRETPLTPIVNVGWAGGATKISGTGNAGIYGTRANLRGPIPENVAETGSFTVIMWIPASDCQFSDEFSNAPAHELSTIYPPLPPDTPHANAAFLPRRFIFGEWKTQLGFNWHHIGEAITGGGVFLDPPQIPTTGFAVFGAGYNGSLFSGFAAFTDLGPSGDVALTQSGSPTSTTAPWDSGTGWLIFENTRGDPISLGRLLFLPAFYDFETESNRRLFTKVCPGNPNRLTIADVSGMTRWLDLAGAPSSIVNNKADGSLWSADTGTTLAKIKGIPGCAA